MAVLTQLGYRSDDAEQLSERVWKAWHLQQQRWDCLKLASSHEHRYGVRQEAYWLQELQQAGFRACAEFRGHYQPASFEVLISAWQPASSLAEFLRQGVEFHTDFSQQLYLAVQQLHRLGICHGDLKPTNILVAQGQPVLIDFASAGRNGTALAALEYRSFSPSFSLPALQQGKGRLDEVHDWYSFLLILNLVNKAAHLRPDWSDSAKATESVNGVLQMTRGLSSDARGYLNEQIQRLPGFA